MNIDLRRLITALLLPSVLLLGVFIFSAQLSRFPSQLAPVQLYLPYLLFAVGLLLAAIFNHSREFNLLIWLLLSYILLEQAYWQTSSLSLNRNSLFSLLCLFVPLNFVINDLQGERGIFNRHGVKRASLIVIQLVCLIWLARHPASQKLLEISLSLPDLKQYTHIPQAALLIMLIASLSLFIFYVLKPNILQATFLLAFLTASLALHYVNQATVASLYFSLAGFMFIVAMIINSHHLAYKDELTQLPSRRALKQQLQALGSQYSIAMVDVDHFKNFNDRHGHDVGDEVLKMLAKHLSKVKGGGKAFRYGGEEFTIVFPGKLTAAVKPALDELRQNIADTPFNMRNKPRPKTRPEHPVKPATIKKLNISVSIGVADNAHDNTSAQAVIKLADKALYKAKQAGRNRVMQTTQKLNTQ